MKHVKLFEDFVNEGKITEGVNDPGILKAFFMAGGPGSGKSFVANELFGFPKNAVSSVSYATGLKLVNSDPAFEKMMKDAGLEPGKLAQYASDENLWDNIVMPIRAKAKNLTRRMQRNYIAGRLGQVIDGTGKDYDKIRGHRQLYKDMGYDTYMVFVNTSKEVALERNRMRERKLDDKMVEEMWGAVQENLGKFQKLFGTDKMIIVDNSKYGNDELLDQIEKEIDKRLNAPVQNQIGKRWIEEQKKANRR
jgi:predicted kinase